MSFSLYSVAAFPSLVLITLVLLVAVGDVFLRVSTTAMVCNLSSIGNLTRASFGLLQNVFSIFDVEQQRVGFARPATLKGL